MSRLLQDGRNWLLGVAATIIATLVINGIVFQRETRETLARQSEHLTYLDRANEAQNRRLDKIVEALDAIYSRLSGLAPERELKERDARFERIERRIEELERRR